MSSPELAQSQQASAIQAQLNKKKKATQKKKKKSEFKEERFSTSNSTIATTRK
jgi:hypothetical protein